MKRLNAAALAGQQCVRTCSAVYMATRPQLAGGDGNCVQSELRFLPAPPPTPMSRSSSAARMASRTCASTGRSRPQSALWLSSMTGVKPPGRATATLITRRLESVLGVLKPRADAGEAQSNWLGYRAVAVRCQHDVAGAAGCSRPRPRRRAGSYRTTGRRTRGWRVELARVAVDPGGEGYPIVLVVALGVVLQIVTQCSTDRPIKQVRRSSDKSTCSRRGCHRARRRGSPQPSRGLRCTPAHAAAPTHRVGPTPRPSLRLRNALE